MSYALIECEKKKIFHFTNIEEVFEEVHIVLPEFNEKHSARYGKKINRILKKYKVSNVILSNELMKNDILKNVICSGNYYLIDGNNMFKVLIKKSIADICDIADTSVQTCKVAILVHEFSIENLNLVKYISKDVKQVVLISDNKIRYEKISEDLIENYGIVLSIFDNEYKNIARCDFVINVDFVEDELKKYNISREAIVISIKEKLAELKRNFNGIIINDIDIYFDEEYKNFRSLAICEAQIYDFKKDFKENERRFDKAGYMINTYIGNNGSITEEDIKRVFTKNSKNNT